MGAVRGYRWQFVTTLAVVTVVIFLLTLIPEEMAPWLVLLIVVAVWPLFILGIPLVFFLLLRPRIFAFAVLSILVLGAAQLALQALQAVLIDSLEQRTMLPTSATHDLVLTDWGSADCDVICMQILAKSKYRYFARQRGDKWTIFVARRGASCAAADNVKSYIAFLSAGFTDICAVRSIEPVRQYALSVVSHHGRTWRRAGRFSVVGSFEGRVLELYERRNGDKRLLGRWVDGHVRPLSYWFGFIGLRQWKVGKPFEVQEFYAAALDAPILSGSYPGGANLELVFDQLQLIPVTPELQRAWLNAFSTLADLHKGEQRDAIVARAVEMLHSSENTRILAGIELLKPFRDLDPGLIQLRILELTGGSDPQVVAEALGMAFRFPPQTRSDLYAKIPTLAVSLALVPADTPALEPLLGHYRAVGVFPEIDRTHARTLLVKNADLSGPQRVALLAIVAHGGQTMREQASDTVLAMDDQALFDLVIAMKGGSWSDLSGLNRDAWSDKEKRHLIDRVAGVPLVKLVAYVNGLRSQGVFSNRSADVADIVQRRLNMARAATPSDTQAISELERLLRSMQP